MNKLQELKKWLNEDKTICKTDKDYICNFITQNYIPKEEVKDCLKEHDFIPSDAKEICQVCGKWESEHFNQVSNPLDPYDKP